MYRFICLIGVATFAASCANPAAKMDPSLTTKFCKTLTASQFDAAQAVASSVFAGTLNGMKVKAYFKDQVGELSMSDRGIIQMPSGTTIKIGDGGNAIFARAKTDTLIARGEGGPICGPIS